MAKRGTPPHDNGSGLTDRELEVAKLIALGIDGKEIADKLDISAKTYDTHRLHIMKKLKLTGSNSSAGLARIALHRHWVSAL